MALDLAKPGRLRSSSRSLNTDEQSSETANLIRQFRLQCEKPDGPEFYRLTGVAEKLHHEVKTQFPAKDVFRHGAGFEDVIELVRLLDLHTTVQRDEGQLLAYFAFTKAVFRLLGAALKGHYGNQKYFASRLDGWKTLQALVDTLQRCLTERLALDLPEFPLASLYDSILGLAIDFDALSTVADGFDINGREGVQPDSGPRAVKWLPPHATLHNPQACASLVHHVLQCVRSADFPHPHLLSASISVLDIISTLVTSNTRNLVALWQTNALSELLHTYFNQDLAHDIEPSLRSLILSLGKYGIPKLDDVAFLFKQAGSSDRARQILLDLVKRSKEPAFIQFDLMYCGYSAVEIPAMPRQFPPQTGFSFAAWIRIDEFDVNVHTTLFGCYDRRHRCFVLMYLEKDSHQLILQTSVRSANPSVRFKSLDFAPSRWYHIALVHRRNTGDPSQSSAFLFVNGSFAEQKKCAYPELPEEIEDRPSQAGASGQHHARFASVQAFFGTPQNIAPSPGPNQIRSRWSMSNGHLYGAPLTDEFIAVQFRLGPRYRGNFQDSLGPLLTYRASSELQRYNDLLHPDKSEKSDIVTATEGRGSDVVSEFRIQLGVDPTSVVDCDPMANVPQLVKYDLDQRAQARFSHLSQTTRKLVINTAIPNMNEALSHQYGTGAMTGDPITVVPQSLDDASWCLSGSVASLFQLVESATSRTAIEESVNIFFECVKDNWRISEAMEKGSGFGALAMIIREKLGFETASSAYGGAQKTSALLTLEDCQTLSVRLLELVLDFVGYNMHRPEDSMLVNPMAYRVLLVDFDTWRRNDLGIQELYWKQFVHFTQLNSHQSFNQKRLVRMRVVKKLIEALKFEDFSEDTAPLLMASLKALLEGGIAHQFYRDLAMFVAWGLHDERAMPLLPMRSMATLVGVRNKLGAWARSARLSKSDPLGNLKPQEKQAKVAMSRFDLAISALGLLADVLCNERATSTIRRFTKVVPNRWLLHLLSETDVRVTELTLSIVCRTLVTLGPEFKATFVDKNGGFLVLKARLKPFWRSPLIWTTCFAILFGRSLIVPTDLGEFTAFRLVEVLGVDGTLEVHHQDILPVLFALLEAGLRHVAKDDQPKQIEANVLKTVIGFLGEVFVRSPAFRDFALESRYVQELLFVLFPLLTGSDRLSADTELLADKDSLSFNGEEVKMRPHSNSLDRRPPSVRSLSQDNTKRTPSPMKANRVEAPRKTTSFLLIHPSDDRLQIPVSQFNSPMAPNGTDPPVRINVTNSIVESLLELAVNLFIYQICTSDKFNGIGLFLRVPPGFREHQAYFESYVLVNALSQLGSHLQLHQALLVETRILTNLARYSQHLAEAVSEGWFIDGAQPLLDFTGEILEYLQQPEIASMKSVRLCSQSTNAIRVVFLKTTLWRLSELDEDAPEKAVTAFLDKMTYWQTILFSSENQETLFTKLMCYLLYHKLGSNTKSIRLAAARLWRIILVQKPTESATLLTYIMGAEQRHLSTGFMKLASVDDDEFLAWVDENRRILDSGFYTSLSKSWDEFVTNENRASGESNKARLNKRRDRLRQWQTEETAADDFLHRYEVSTNHWRANVHGQERVKLQRALQDHQENVNHLHTVFSRLESLVHQPCGLDPITEPARWQLDETEAANRMRMRVVPDTTEHKEVFQPKRKYSERRVTNELSVNTQIPRIISDHVVASVPGTPATPLLGNDDTERSNQQSDARQSRSDSVSNSQLLEGGFEMVDDPKEDEDGLIEDKNRKIMTSLQRGDQVHQLYNISRIVGLEACDGLLIIGKDCLYMQDGFFQRSDGEIVSVSQAPEDERDPYVQLISGQDVGATRTKHSIGDQETRHWTWAEVLSISKRRFLLRDVSFEVFFTDGRSYLITCISPKIRDDLYAAIVSRAPHVHSSSVVATEDAWRLDTLRNPEEAPQSIGSKFGSLFNATPTHAATKKWMRGEMSNFQYLMLVNTMAGRTFNDLTQYPVFPWVLADYTSEELDLTDSKSFRDFSKPMGCQTPLRAAEYRERYQQFAEMGGEGAPAFHYGTHYSSAMIVSSYLIRLQPFVQSYLLLQGGAFDHADRLFDSVEKAWMSASRDNMSDVRELTPEFFYLPEFLRNVNKYDFGAKQVGGEVVNDVQLPKWAKGDPHIFVAKHREALESPYVSDHLHEWIDLIFGYKQRGEAAIEATNVFQHLSYGGAKDLDKIDDHMERLATIGIIHSFGQTPHQVFPRAHPYREQARPAQPRLDAVVESLIRLPDTMFHLNEKVASFTFPPNQERLLCSGSGKLNILPSCDRYMQWGFADHSIRFYSAHSKRLLGLYENTHVGPITTATFVDSRTLITAGIDSTIGVWTLTTSRELIEIHPKTYLFGHRAPVTILAASRVFSTLLSVSSDGHALLWGLNRHNCIRVLLPAGGAPIQAARISNVSGHILLCRGAYVLLYTLNGHLLLEQKLSDREDENIACCAFYEGVGNEFLERELLFTGHAHGIANAWTLTTLSDGAWHLQLVKRMSHFDSARSAADGGHAEITAILPMPKAVYTGDADGNVWEWDCVQRQASGIGLRPGSIISLRGR